MEGKVKKILIILGIIILLALVLFGCTKISKESSTKDEERAEAEIIALEEGKQLDDNFNIVGKAIQTYASNLRYISCSDSDGGKNYDVYGEVTLKYSYRGRQTSQPFKDRCQKNQIFEYYCNKNNLALAVYKCPKGCENGACKTCDGCLLDGKCFIWGNRYDGKFCSAENNNFVEQFEEGSSCNYNYECSNDLCVEGKCLGVLQNYCEELISGINDASARRLNLIFVGVDYSLDVLKSKAKDFLDWNQEAEGLFTLEPFKSRKDRFNFWFVNKTIETNGELNYDYINALIRGCKLPNWYGYIFIVNEGGRSSAGFGPNSSTVLLNNDIGPRAIHETGHLIGNLWDEYPSGRLENPTIYNHFSVENQLNVFYNASLDNDGQVSFSECRNNAPWKEWIGKGCGNNNSIDCIDKYVLHKSYMLWDKNISDPSRINLPCSFSIDPIKGNISKLICPLADEYCDYGEEENCLIELNGRLVNPFNPGEGFTSVLLDSNGNYRQEVFTFDLLCKDGYVNGECMDEIDCFQGGHYFVYNIYRPTFNGVMKGGQNFGVYNEYLIRQQIDKYSN
jgi:hypothetical protein